MAKVRGPLFSISAKGKYGKSLIFSSAHGVNIVKRFIKALDPRSSSQLLERDYFLIAVGEWNALTPEEQADYETLAKKMQMTGYNYFIKLSIDDEIASADYCSYDNDFYNQKNYAPNGFS